MPSSLLRKFCACLAVTLLARGAEWSQGQGFRSMPVAPPAGKPGFTLLAPENTGIFFTNVQPEWRYRTNQVLLNGSGVAAGDVDGDGLCDLYFSRLHGPNVLYRNLGNFRFEDITQSAGVACPDIDSTGVAFADLDGDGDLDLVVSSLGGGTHIFLNDGKAHFTELTRNAPLNPKKGGSSLAIGDLDGDGFLDLYVENYRVLALMDLPNTRFFIKKVNGKQVVATVNGRPVTDPDLVDRFVVTPRGGIDELGEADVIYRNVGGTNFVPLSFTNGAFLDEDGHALTKPPFDWGLSVMIRDINQDGRPDIYVCNDFNTPDRIWINQGGGKFRLLPRLAMRKGSMFCMGVDFADINRDGHDDFMLLDMLSPDHERRLTTMGDRNISTTAVGQIDNRPEYMMNTLFLNRGDGTYAEIGQMAGLSMSDWSWCTIFLDVDLDGWEDVLITNGHERAARDLDVVDQLRTIRTQRQLTPEQILESRKIIPRLATPNLAFRNRRDLTFEDKSREWGFDLTGVSHGMALADLDNDGDLDVIINNLHAPASILRNNAAAPRVGVRLKGQAPNTAGIGAKIKVTGGPVAQQQEMICGGRYVSCDQAMRVFAAGAETNFLTIEVRWPSGRTSTVSGARANQVYEVMEPAGARGPEGSKGGDQASSPTLAAGWFEDVSTRLNHVHADEPFDDFARQPLLPNKLSQLGPGVTWLDLDGDGWDDLVIGSGRGGTLAAYRNDGRGGFQRVEAPPFTAPVTRDQTAVLAIPRGTGKPLLLAGSANYEDGQTNGSCISEYDLDRKLVVNRLPDFPWSAGPVAAADIDGDGTLDLFVGGRVVAGRYPEPASCALFRNSAGSWTLDAENTKRLAGAGLVSGAVFSDLDGDGWPDLLLACEWGPIRVFHNEKGMLVEQTSALGLAGFKGWWNGIATGDFDGDGRMDIVASNRGRNSRYEAHRTRPLQLYYGDLNGDGAAQLLEGHYDEVVGRIVPELGLNAVANALPFVRAIYSTHHAYAKANVEDLLGDRLAAAKVLEAGWLETTVFLNRGTNFVAKVLPPQAQIAPAFGICVGDFDGDGNQDLFLAQNFFEPMIETPRYDAGAGLVLKGDGQGGFIPLSPMQSGIEMFGEQRGAAMADFDGDGRIDLLVGQNGQQTKLYHNTGARPGVRVRLAGAAGNPTGVGAQVRLAGEGWEGPVQEIQCGSGYWSQNSATVVMTSAKTATHVVVRWPGGEMVRVPVPAGAREVVVKR